MLVVRAIDLLVIVLKILGGRTKTNPAVRFALWLLTIAAAVAGVAVLGLLLRLLADRLTEGGAAT